MRSRLKRVSGVDVSTEHPPMPCAGGSVHRCRGSVERDGCIIKGIDMITVAFETGGGGAAGAGDELISSNRTRVSYPYARCLGSNTNSREKPEGTLEAFGDST